MEHELAWPHPSDLLPGGPLAPYSARCLMALLIGAWACLANLYFGLALGLTILLLSPGGWRSRLSEPEWVGRGGYRERVPERSQRFQFLLLLVLLGLAWSSQAAIAFALAMPLVLYRVFSMLWTELDLESGQVWHHRTFLGLQLKRLGADLNQAQAVVSGLKRSKPGEEVTYSTALWLGDGGMVSVQADVADLKACHQDGRRLAHKLDLPHYAIKNGESFRSTYPENYWPPLTLQQSETRGLLPWEAP